VFGVGFLFDIFGAGCDGDDAGFGSARAAVLVSLRHGDVIPLPVFRPNIGPRVQAIHSPRARRSSSFAD